jgi:hypothetical protein
MDVDEQRAERGPVFVQLGAIEVTQLGRVDRVRPVGEGQLLEIGEGAEEEGKRSKCVLDCGSERCKPSYVARERSEMSSPRRESFARCPRCRSEGPV